MNEANKKEVNRELMKLLSVLKYYIERDKDEMAQIVFIDYITKSCRAKSSQKIEKGFKEIRDFLFRKGKKDCTNEFVKDLIFHCGEPILQFWDQSVTVLGVDSEDEFLAEVLYALFIKRIGIAKGHLRAKLEEYGAIPSGLKEKVIELSRLEYRSSIVTKPPPEKPNKTGEMIELRKDFEDLKKMQDVQKRGYKLEEFLIRLLRTSNLEPKGPFKVEDGIKIDGSFYWSPYTFLVEARWQNQKTKIRDLTALSESAAKSADTRGLFISMKGFSVDAGDYKTTGQPLRIFGMNGNDLELILRGEYALCEALKIKHRAMGEGHFFLPLAYPKKS